MSNRNRNNDSGAMLLFLIFFWPIGLYFLFQKLNRDKTATFTTYKIIALLGWAMTILAAALFVGCLYGKSVADETESGLYYLGALYFVFLFFGGVFLIIKASFMKKRALRFKQYINITANNHISDIDDIAKAVSLDNGHVTRDLQKMVGLGYFRNGYVDLGARKLVLPHMMSANPFGSDYAPLGKQQPSGPRTVSCRCCGANNTVTSGQSSACEYCGSPL